MKIRGELDEAEEANSDDDEQVAGVTRFIPKSTVFGLLSGPKVAACRACGRMTAVTTFENEADAEADLHAKKQSTLNSAVSQKGSFPSAKKDDSVATFESEGK